VNRLLRISRARPALVVYAFAKKDTARRLRTTRDGLSRASAHFGAPLRQLVEDSWAHSVADWATSHGLKRVLRGLLSKKVPSCWSFCSASVLPQQLHSSLCACCRALNPNKDPAQSGIFFSGNRLSLEAPAGPWRDELETARGLSEREGTELQVLRRSWDDCFWPYASAGYFRFKHEAWRFLRELTA